MIRFLRGRPFSLSSRLNPFRKLSAGDGPGPGPTPGLVYCMDPAAPGAMPPSTGTLVAWDGVGQFKRYGNSQGVATPIGDKTLTPSKVVNGATIYPFYPRWVAGESAAIGDLKWASIRATGKCHVVRFNEAVPSLPNPWEYDTINIDIREEYQPELGFISERNFEQLLLNPTRLEFGWDLVNGGTRREIVYPANEALIQDFTRTCVIGSTISGDGISTTNFSVTQFDPYMIRLIFRQIDSDKCKARLLGQDFEYDFSTHRITNLGGNLLITQIRYLRDNWIDVTLRHQSAPSFAEIILYGSDQIAGETEYGYCGCIPLTNSLAETFEPNPSTGFGADAGELRISTDYQTDWVDEGCDANFTLLLNYHRESDEFEVGSKLWSWREASASTTSVRHAWFGDGRIYAQFGDGAEYNVRNSGGESILENHLQIYGGQGQNCVTNFATVGEALKTGFTAGYTGGIDSAGDGIYAGHDPRQTAQQSRVIIRNCCIWSLYNAYDWDTEFGPANYTNQP